MEIHSQMTESADFQAFAKTKDFAANCVHISELKFAFLTVIGTVDAPNPGAHPRLECSNPQGWNPKILLLDLVFDQEPGIWNQVVTQKPVGYSKALSNCDVYDEVTIQGLTTVTIKKTIL